MQPQMQNKQDEQITGSHSQSILTTAWEPEICFIVKYTKIRYFCKQTPKGRYPI